MFDPYELQYVAPLFVCTRMYRNFLFFTFVKECKGIGYIAWLEIKIIGEFSKK